MTYLPYQILRNLAPEGMTAARQRAADEQLGIIVAALTRRGRTNRRATACTDTGAGRGSPAADQLSKGDRELRPAGRTARCAT